MGKNIKDYLHLYLGSKVQTPIGIGILISVGDSERGEDCIVSAQNNDEESGFYGEWTDYDFEHSKLAPILRPLSDMTEEEGKEIIGLIYQSIFQDIPAISTIEKLTEDDKVGFIAFEKELNLRLSVTAEVDRGVEFYENGSQMKVRQFDVTAWLLSKHFDIFGLIEAGLAIDATEEAVS